MGPSPPSVTEGAYRALRLEVLGGRVAPGAKLKIGEICTRLNINLSAVREALTRLAAEGVITAEPQRGFRVAKISGAELIDLTRTRTEIELLCLTRGIESGDVAWESRIVAASHALSRTPRPSPLEDPAGYALWEQAHHAYHEALCSGCDSPWLLRLRDQLSTQSERYVRLSLRMGKRRRSADDEHRQITEAVLARDIDRVRTLIAAHFQTTTANLLDALGFDGVDALGEEVPAFGNVGTVSTR